MSEKQKIGRVNEARELTSHESIAIVNPIVHSEGVLYSVNAGEMDNPATDCIEKSEENLHDTEHEEVLAAARIIQEDARIEIAPRRRRQTGTVLWEPLLVPSEVDGKVEMVTALKRVDSNYISSPRVSQRLTGLQVANEAKFSPSSRMEMQGSSGRTNPPSKAVLSRSSADAEMKHDIKKDVYKKKASDISINEQMGKAIAAKEAAILKEIEKAMKEANVKTKLELSNPSGSSKNKPFIEQTKSQTPVRLTPTQNVKKSVDSLPIETEFLKDSSDPVDGGNVSQSSPIGVPMGRIQNAPILRTVSSPNVGAVLKEKPGYVKGKSAKTVATSSSVAKSLTKESKSLNKLLNLPTGAVMVTSPSAVVTVPKDGQAATKIYRTSGAVIGSPTSTVFTARDAHAVNQLIALPVNTTSNPQNLKEISPTSGPRIILLTTPHEGGLPLLTPFIPTTNVPALAPLSSSSKTTSRRPRDVHGSAKGSEKEAMPENYYSTTMTEIRVQTEDQESPNGKDPTGQLLGLDQLEATGQAAILRYNKSPNENATENTLAQLPLQKTQPSLDEKKSSHAFSLPKASQELKNGSVQKELKNASAVSLSKHEAVERQQRLIKTYGKTAASNLCTQQNALQAPVKITQRMDSNGESMDVDDELMSDELDQGIVEETKNIGTQNLPATEEKNNICAEGNKLSLKQLNNVKISSKKSEKHKSTDSSTSEATLEARLQRMEELYNEIPSVKPSLSLTEEEFGSIRDSLRNSVYNLMGISTSFKNFIRQSSVGYQGLSQSLPKTDASIDNDGTDVPPVDKCDIVETDCKNCRLCGGIFKKSSLIFLFGKLSKKKNLLSMLSTILPQTPVRESDGLPQQVCEACVEKLTLCHSIIDQFLRADKELRHALKKEKPFDSVSPSVVENCMTLPEDNQMTSKDNQVISEGKQESFEDNQVTSEENQISSEDNQMSSEGNQVMSEDSQVTPEDNQVISEDNQVTSEDNQMTTEDNQMISEETVKSADDLHVETEEIQNHTGVHEIPEVVDLKGDVQTSVQPHGVKRTRGNVDSESSTAESSTLNHKHKRRRNKSPHRAVRLPKSIAPPKSTAGCIDLSRLDPEYNDGFEVEWCLDEETIRSSLVPEEEVETGLNEDSAVETINVSLDAATAVSSESGFQEGVPFTPDTQDFPQTGSHESITKHTLRSETPKHGDEVSKLSEMHTSVCESSVKSGTKRNSVSSVRQEKRDKQLHFLTKSPETFKCSTCPLSFGSKQEAFAHKVKQHKEELVGLFNSNPGKQDSGNAIKNKNISQKQTVSVDSKIENESSEESVMCDQCGLPFPNQYSLSRHECISHETSANSHLIIKDSKGLEYKVVCSKEAAGQNEAGQEVSEASLTDGKILVKCGSGMLWVNCSKFFTDEQLTALQSSDLSGITYLNVENDVVDFISSDQNVANTSPRKVAKVQFAYKCDHCKQIFSGRSDLLTHMQSHLTEVSCKECGAKFPTIKALNAHIPSHIPLDCVCSECGLILSDNKKLMQHRKEHIHNLPHVCEFCGKKFPNEQTLEVHETIHFSKKGPLACSLCRKCFFFKYSLVRHRSQHASNRLQKCSLCFRVLNSSDQLRKHVALHQLMRNFVCFCKQTFPSQKELVEHRYLKHSYAEIFCARNKVEILEPLPLHQCSVCLRVLNSKQSLLKHHVTSHSETWPFYCIQCSRKYKSMFHLARHECHRKYTSAFQCRICGKAFQNRNIFKQHKIIHNNRKWKYICRHCGKAFQKSQSLVSHIMTHGGKKFLCPRCHQPCQDKEGLLKHYNNGSCQMKGKSLQ